MTVEVVVGNGAETMARIETEGDNPQWDVVWLDSMPSIYSMGQKGMLLTEWEPSNAANLTDYFKEIVPADKAYYPTGAHAAGCYRVPERCVHRGNGAQNMGRFRQGRYKDQIGMADPALRLRRIRLFPGSSISRKWKAEKNSSTPCLRTA